MIFLLRDPVERAISNMEFSRMNGFETAAPEIALLRELENPSAVTAHDDAPISASPHAYLSRGQYADRLQPFFEVFGSDAITLLVTETLVGDAAQLRRVFASLGVDPSFVPPALGERVNQSDRQSGPAVPDAVRARLADYFRPGAERLASRHGVDISSWLL